jgi:hypothetical protein
VGARETLAPRPFAAPRAVDGILVLDETVWPERERHARAIIDDCLWALEHDSAEARESSCDAEFVSLERGVRRALASRATLLRLIGRLPEPI